MQWINLTVNFEFFDASGGGAWRLPLTIIEEKIMAENGIGQRICLILALIMRTG